jgi:signal transduction histidine kinase
MAKAAVIVCTFTGADMVPYNVRLALRVTRVVLALGCLAWYPFTGGRISAALVFLVVYAVWTVATLFAARFDAPSGATAALAGDFLFFAFCNWFLPAGWAPALAYGYLLLSAVMLHALARAVSVAAAAMLFILALAIPGGGAVWANLSAAVVAVSLAFYKRYLEGRMSNTLRYNMIIRSQAEGARDAERQRIAADFHDGPLQSFISFQMRLEIIRKLLGRDVDAATDELRQLRELCRNQVTELRGFVRSMRPVEEGVSLSASLSRMVDQFQRDTGVSATFSAGDFPDPGQTELSLELLQIVRETLNNIHKHSGASRAAVTLARNSGKLELRAEDNGGGFPFSGAFTLDEMELMHMGPGSIKRRVRLLGGELMIESRPGQGSCLEIRFPL